MYIPIGNLCNFFKEIDVSVKYFLLKSCYLAPKLKPLCNRASFHVSNSSKLAGDDQSNDSSRTFVFYDEGHTLGNALRSVITSYPEVMFCGYTVPHPAETKMHFRIQTDGVRAVDILQRGLEDLEKICDHTLKVFDGAMKDYNKKENASIGEEKEVSS